MSGNELQTDGQATEKQKNFGDRFSRFDTIPKCDGPTDEQKK